MSQKLNKDIEQKNPCLCCFLPPYPKYGMKYLGRVQAQHILEIEILVLVRKNKKYLAGFYRGNRTECP